MVFNGYNYKLLEDHKEAFDDEIVKDKMTDYFIDFDYVVGDWAYGKLRLKGFYDAKNTKVSEINNIKNVKQYVEENCAYGCKYFILEKVGEGKE